MNLPQFPTGPLFIPHLVQWETVRYLARLRTAAKPAAALLHSRILRRLSLVLFGFVSRCGSFLYLASFFFGIGGSTKARKSLMWPRFWRRTPQLRLPSKVGTGLSSAACFYLYHNYFSCGCCSPNALMSLKRTMLSRFLVK